MTGDKKEITKTTAPVESIAKKKPRKSKPMDYENREELIQNKKKLLKTTNRLKSDYKEGLITKEIYDNLRIEYKQKLKIINKKIEKWDTESGTERGVEIDSKDEAPELKKLMVKKEKILKAINKLEDDKEAGIIDDELYEEMAGTYKKQAIEIMRNIDHLREN